MKTNKNNEQILNNFQFTKTPLNNSELSNSIASVTTSKASYPELLQE